MRVILDVVPPIFPSLLEWWGLISWCMDSLSLSNSSFSSNFLNSEIWNYIEVLSLRVSTIHVHIVFNVSIWLLRGDSCSMSFCIRCICLWNWAIYCYPNFSNCFWIIDSMMLMGICSNQSEVWLRSPTSSVWLTGVVFHKQQKLFQLGE